MKNNYSFSDVQKLLHITRPALRYYLEKGLIDCKKDEKNGYISFAETNIEDLAEIIYLRQILDFSIEEIRGYLKAETTEDLFSLYFMHKEILKQQIEMKKNQLAILDSMECELDMVRMMGCSFSIMHEEAACPLWIPLKGAEELMGYMSSPEEWLWEYDVCNVFKTDEEGDFGYTGIGFFPAVGQSQKPDYGLQKYSLEILPPGDYLCGISSVEGEFCDHMILNPFLEYAKAQGLILGDIAISVVYFVSRNDSNRRYHCYVKIPLK